VANTDIVQESVANTSRYRTGIGG